MVGSLQGNTGFAVSEAMVQKAEKTIADAQKAGVAIIAGTNGENGVTGAALEPTFITCVTPDNPLHDL